MFISKLIISVGLALASIIILGFGSDRYTEIAVDVNWVDDQHYVESNQNWYLGVSEGKVSHRIADVKEPFNIIPVTAGNAETVRFLYPSEDAGDYTAFIFCDVNNNGSYEGDYDEVTGYAYNFGEPSETLGIEVLAVY